MLEIENTIQDRNRKVDSIHQADNKKNQGDWEEFVKWCEINKCNPKNGKSLRDYVKKMKEGEL
jgi:hypothetical protein